MKNSTIYKIESKLKPERCYIGSAVDVQQRWRCHLHLLRKNKHDNNKLQNHYNKYGELDLVFIIIEPCFPQFLIIREQFYIDTLKPWFNIAKIAGSQLGFKHSEETIRNNSLAKIGNKNMLGKHHSKESNEKNRQSHLGKKLLFKRKRLSEDDRKKMSENKLGKKRKPFTSEQVNLGEKNPNYY